MKIQNQPILHFLGRGAAFNPSMDNTNAWFSYNEVFYLLDCGESSFQKLWNLEAFLSSKKLVLIVTHLHCDHSGSIGSLLSFCHEILHKPVEIVSPSNQIEIFLAIVGIQPSFYFHYPELPFTKGLEIVAYKVEHAPDMDCYGYKITMQNTTFYYSGDAHKINPVILQQFLSGKIDYIFHDTSKEKSNHHCSLATLEKEIPLPFRDKVYCMHLDCDFIDSIISKGFNVVEVS